MRKTIFSLILLSFLSVSTVFADVNSEPSFLWKDMGEPSVEEKAYDVIERMKDEIENDPENYTNYEEIAIFYDYIGFHEKAIEALKMAIKYYPEDEIDKDVLYGNLAREHIILKQLDEAKIAIDKALELNPANIINNMHLVQYYLMKNRYKKAALAMKKESDLGSEEDTYFNWYRYAFFDLKIDSSKLVDTFKYAVELDPESHDARRTFATAIRSDFGNLEKNFSEIMGEYEKALNCKPNHIATHICIADTYMFMAIKTRNDDYNESALEWFNRACSINPEDEKLLYAMATFYRYTKRYDEAILKLEKAMSLDFKDEEYIKESLSKVYNNKAYSLYEKGEDLGKGLELIDKAIALRPNNGVFLSTKAELLYKMGKFEEAYAYIKKGIALEPDYEEIRQDLVRIEEALKIKK